MVRNPVKDQVAIVGIGSTGFTRTNERGALALGLEAATQAIRDAGLGAADIDGVVAVAEPGRRLRRFARRRSG
jgi:3-oxoacyl-[acyl-carrier-protein] synthase III